MRRAALASAWVVVLLALPRLAEACAGCIARGDDESRAAFVGTTVLLTFLPLIVVGGAVWWLLRRARELDPIQPAEESVPEAAPVRRASSSR